MDNLELWNKVKQAPPSALKPIQAGRLKGKSDISPQWRYQALTEQFGPCGEGWRYEIQKIWNEPGANEETFVFAHINLFFIRINTGQRCWSEAIPGIGGSKVIQREWDKTNKAWKLYNNDEGYKMAVTDALGTACKMLGVAADVYMGLWDGSKYTGGNGGKPSPAPAAKAPPKVAYVTAKQYADLLKVGAGMDLNKDEVGKVAAWYRKSDKMTAAEAASLIKNWDSEFNKFLDAREQYEAHGPDKEFGDEG